jgi:flagellar basal body-associated protein FliL
MEEKPEILASAEVQNETPKAEKSKAVPIVIGLVVLLVVFAGAVLLLSGNSDTGKDNSQAVTTTKTEQQVSSTADLDKVSQELDNENLDNYEEELNQNDQDAAAF